MYRPFDSWAANSDWQVSLPPGEEAVAVTAGQSFSALATSQHTLRLFSPAGAPLSSAGLTCALVLLLSQCVLKWVSDVCAAPLLTAMTAFCIHPFT